MLLHIFRHVQPGDGGLVVEQEVGQGLGQFGLAHAGRAQEQETAQGPVGVVQAGAGAAHRVGDGGERLVLAHHAGGQGLLHLQQFFALALQHLVDRHAGPAADDGGDLFGVDHLGRQGAGFVGLVRLGLGQLFLDLGDLAIGDLGRATQIAGALGVGQLQTQAVQGFAQLGALADLFLLGLPLGGQVVGLAFQIGDLVLQLL